MFIEFHRGMSKDITFCKAEHCPIKECGRHIKHCPKNKPVSIADFEPVCRSYMLTVVEEAER